MDTVVAISKESLFTAQHLVTGCEACDPTASLSFTSVLDAVTNRTDRVTDYILGEAAKCGKCGGQIVETTLVTLDDVELGLTSFDLDTPTEQTHVFLIDEPVVREAEGWIESCEKCSPQTAEYSFDQ